MQQRLAGAAADVQADAAALGVALGQNYFEAQIGGAKDGGVGTRASTEHQLIEIHVDAAGIAGSSRGAHRWRDRRYKLCSFLFR